MHWPAATSVLSAKAPIPSAGESGVPSASVIFWVALWVAKQYCGRPRRHDRQSPQTARQFRTTKSPGATEVTSGPDGLDDAGRLVAEQERELVVDPALPVVEVGVAHAARLDPTTASPGPGSGTTMVTTWTGSPTAIATTPRTSDAMCRSCLSSARSGTVWHAGHEPARSAERRPGRTARWYRDCAGRRRGGPGRHGRRPGRPTDRERRSWQTIDRVPGDGRPRPTPGARRCCASALDVIAERGFADTRIADVAERAGTSPALVIYYFQTKDNLLTEAVRLAEDLWYDYGFQRVAAVDGCGGPPRSG